MLVSLGQGAAGVNPGRLPGGGRDRKEGVGQGDLGANPGAAPFWLWSEAMVFGLRLSVLICKMGS